MEKSKKDYKEVSRQLINLVFGNKLEIKDDKNVKDEEKVEVTNNGKEALPPPLPFYQIFFNLVSSIAIIVYLVFGLTIPFATIVAMGMIDFYTIIKAIGVSKLLSDINIVAPVFQWISGAIVTMTVLSSATLLIILITALFLKWVLSCLEMGYLKLSIAKNYGKIKTKLKALDEQEEMIKRKNGIKEE
jgi:hypothetical protein